jgi:hypothetical protein
MAIQSRGGNTQIVYQERRPNGSLGDPVGFLKSTSNQGFPQFSPDGRWVAFTSDESGREEVYAADFPAGANKSQISTKGGSTPHWRRDGGEIFYREGYRLMAVSVRMRPTFSPGAPALLFSMTNPQYDVAPDDKRFITLQRPAGEPPLAIHVVHNWFEEFRGQTK